MAMDSAPSSSMAPPQNSCPLVPMDPRLTNRPSPAQPLPSNMPIPPPGPSGPYPPHHVYPTPPHGYPPHQIPPHGYPMPPGMPHQARGMIPHGMPPYGPPNGYPQRHQFGPAAMRHRPPFGPPGNMPTMRGPSEQQGQNGGAQGPTPASMSKVQMWHQTHFADSGVQSMSHSTVRLEQI